MNLGSIIKNFKNLQEFNEFLAVLVEGEADKGQEVSRGMDPNDKSKSQKAGDMMGAPGDMGPPGNVPPEENVIPGQDPNIPPPAPAPAIDPVAAPGSQIAIGKKIKSDIHEKPKTKAVKFTGGEQTKVDTKPSIIINGKKSGL